MVRVKQIKQIHKCDFATENLYATLQGYIGYDGLKYDDIDIINIGYGRADSTPMPIEDLKEMIRWVEAKGSTHVAIDYNCDHDEYEISGYTYEQLSAEELEEIENKKLTEVEKIKKIRNLEKQIQDIKNGKS
jgi:hypothetical protein